MAKRKLITFDWALKRLLRSKANFEILEGFLSELLKDDIIILEILESESNQDTHRDKSNCVDLKVKNNKDEFIIIEVQYAREYDYFHRILWGVSKAVTEHLQKGDPYAQVVKVISISILYFDLGQGKDYVYHGTTRFHGLHHQDELQLNQEQKKRFQKEEVQDIYPEYYLLKVNQFDDVAKDNLDEWMYFLKNEEIKDEFQARGLQRAKETLDVMRLPEDQRQDYEVYLEDLHYQASMYLSSYGTGEYEGLKRGREEGLKEGREEGLKRGREEGLKEGREEGLKEGMEKGREEGLKKGMEKGWEEGTRNKALLIAAQLLDILDDEIIARKTGLSLEVVKQLRVQTD